MYFVSPRSYSFGATNSNAGCLAPFSPSWRPQQLGTQDRRRFALMNLREKQITRIYLHKYIYIGINLTSPLHFNCRNDKRRGHTFVLKTYPFAAIAHMQPQSPCIA
jgi:hypothetical protein